MKWIPNSYDIEANNLTISNKTTINRSYFYSSTRDIPVINNKYYLASGVHYFDTNTGQPFTLDKGITLEDTGKTIQIVGNVNILYTGSGDIFSQTLTTAVILYLDSILLLGGSVSPNANKVFNLTSTGASRAVVLVDFCQFLLFSSVGSLTGFNTIVLNNISFRFVQAGLTMDSTQSLININTGEFQNGYGNLTYFDISGSGNINIQVSNCLFIPNYTTEYFIKIANTLTPNCIINNCVYDRRNVSSTDLLFFNTAGLDQTSVYIFSKNVKNVKDSTISSELTADVETLITITDRYAWHLITLPTGSVSSNTEKMSNNLTTGWTTFTSLETSLLLVYGTFTLKTFSGTEDIECQFIKMKPKVSCTVNNTTNEITRTSHDLSNGDVVLLSASVIPGGLSATIVYYVVNKTTNTFQVSLTLGGSAVDITTDGTSVEYYYGQLFGSHIGADITSTRYLPISPSGLTTAYTNDILIPVVKNNDSTTDVYVKEFYTRCVRG